MTKPNVMPPATMSFKEFTELHCPPEVMRAVIGNLAQFYEEDELATVFISPTDVLHHAGLAHAFSFMANIDHERLTVDHYLTFLRDLLRIKKSQIAERSHFSAEMVDAAIVYVNKLLNSKQIAPLQWSYVSQIVAEIVATEDTFTGFATLILFNKYFPAGTIHTQARIRSIEAAAPPSAKSVRPDNQAPRPPVIDPRYANLSPQHELEARRQYSADPEADIYKSNRLSDGTYPFFCWSLVGELLVVKKFIIRQKGMWVETCLAADNSKMSLHKLRDLFGSEISWGVRP